MDDFDKELSELLNSDSDDAITEPAADERKKNLDYANRLIQDYVDVLREGGTPLVIADAHGDPYVSVTVLASLVEDMHKVFTVFDAIQGNEVFANRHKGFDSLRTAILGMMEAGLADAIKHGEISL